MYSFSPSHDVSHPPFQVFSTVPQSHIPRPGLASLWPCCKSVSAVPQGPNQTRCIHHALEGVMTDSAFLASPFPTACKKSSLYHDTGGPGDACSTEAMCELPQGSYACKPQKVGDGQLCKAAHHLLVLIVTKQQTECRSIPTAAKFAYRQSFWHL